MKFNHLAGQHLEIGSAKIYFEIGGDESRPNLLFLHGGFGNIEDFNPVLAGLAQQYRIIGIDTRGQGASTLGAQPLTYELIQKDFEQVLAHLSVDTLSIIGFSDGGIAAYRLASLTSLKIEKLVTIGARWHMKNLAAIRELLVKVTGESWRKKFPETYDTYQRLNSEPDFDALAGAIVKMWLDESPSGHPNEAIKNISCPLLIVRGDDDHLVAREAVCELSAIIKDARLFNIPFAGHVAFENQKEIFMLGLNKFLAASAD